MSECTSARGKWSTPGKPPNICPACRQPMPVLPPPMSAPGWKGRSERLSGAGKGPEPFLRPGWKPMPFKFVRRKAA